VMQQYPGGFSHWLCALAFQLAPAYEIALIGDPLAEDTQAMLEVVRRPYRPFQAVALAAPGDESAGQIIPLLASRPQQDGRATAYVCRNLTCHTPVTDPGAFQSQLAFANLGL